MTLRIDADGDRVGLVTVERDCPCGAGRFVAKVLPGSFAMPRGVK